VAGAAAAPPDVEEVVYPLDQAQRDLVLEIERVSDELKRDLSALKARGAADDILQATCAKLLARAKDSLTRRDSSADFAARYLHMTRNSLVTAYRQVRARLNRAGG
jgi:DNA-directed RNA polymerase specialized sigma24 family protein